MQEEEAETREVTDGEDTDSEMKLQDLRDAFVRLDVADAKSVLEIDPLTAKRFARRQLRHASLAFRQRQPVFSGR